MNNIRWIFQSLLDISNVGEDLKLIKATIDDPCMFNFMCVKDWMMSLFVICKALKYLSIIVLTLLIEKFHATAI